MFKRVKQQTIKLYSILSSQLSNISIQDGNFIFVRDTRETFLDVLNERIQYNSVIVLSTESWRESIQNPVAGLYYVKESKTLYEYNTSEGWTEIVGSGGNNYFIDSEEDLPEIGKSGVLYIKDTQIFKWDEDAGQYRELGGPTWGTF